MQTFFSTRILALTGSLTSPANNNLNSQLNYQSIKDFVNDSLYEINKSIIEGHYIINDIESNINIVNNDLDSLLFNFPNYLDLKKNLDVIRNGLNKYLSFNDRVKNIYGIKIIDYRSTTRSVRSLFHSELKLLDFNIKINLIDNNFSANNYSIIKLFTLKNEISLLTTAGNFTNIHTALETKINFLSYKWYLRTAQKENNLQYSSILTNLEAQIPPNIFHDWIQKMLNHYEITGNWTHYFSNKYNLLRPLSNNSLNFFQINDKIKYLKDVSKNEDELKTLLDDTEIHLNGIITNTELELKSHDLLLNYIINNYYSLYCERKYKNFEFLKNQNTKEILQKSKDLVDDILSKYYQLNSKTKGNTNNFFLDYKVSFYCTKILNELYEVCFNKNIFIEIFHVDITDKIYNIIDNYKRKKDWSLLNNNYIFKLDYYSSLINHNTFNVYYASSFTLAKVDDDIENKFRSVEESYKDLKLRNIFKHEIETIHSLNSEFKRENKRLIEIVSAFTAIISFIVGSIGAFEFIKTFYQAIFFLSIFGIAISTFVLITFITTRGLATFRKNWFVLIPYFALFIILAILTFYNKEELKFPEKELQNLEKKYQLKIDSIQNINNSKIENLVNKITPQKQGGKTTRSSTKSN